MTDVSNCTTTLGAAYEKQSATVAFTRKLFALCMSFIRWMTQKAVLPIPLIFKAAHDQAVVTEAIMALSMREVR